MLYFMRMFVHYFGQYIVLRMLSVPVTRFTPGWARIYLEYAPFEFYQEAFCMITGAISNTLVFIGLYVIGYLVKNTNVCCGCHTFPKYWHNVICWHGMWMVFDPMVTIILDCATQNWDWGDWFVIARYFQKNEKYGSPAIGIYLTFFCVICVMIFNGYFFYRYMVFRFKEGRILDLYRRLSGEYNIFFVPQDREISLNYLRWVITRAKKRNFVIQSERKTIYDKYGIDRLVNFI
jgi:hypothetical protein